MCQSFCLRNADSVGFQPGGSKALRGSTIGESGKRSVRGDLGGTLACLALAGVLACSSLPPHPKIPTTGGQFSDAMVRAHLENLSGLGPRLPGSEADRTARAYFRREFRQAGAETELLEAGEYHHLIAEIPGASQDGILLVAPYSALGGDAWVDDSGAVLLLELTRVLASPPPPYTVRIALAYVRPRAVAQNAAESPSGATGGRAGPNGSALLAREQVTLAGESLASALEADGRLDGLRAVIAFELRAGRVPRMARDLRSHPVFRSVFWEAAAALGHGDSFPPDAGWRSPPGLQDAFLARGLGLVLALVDETTARAELQAGLGAVGEVGAAGARGVEPLGSVTLEALSRLMGRFERVDAFAE